LTMADGADKEERVGDWLRNLLFWHLSRGLLLLADDR
jgi:hypothetical protein